MYVAIKNRGLNDSGAVRFLSLDLLAAIFGS